MACPFYLGIVVLSLQINLEKFEFISFISARATVGSLALLIQYLFNYMGESIQEWNK